MNRRAYVLFIALMLLVCAPAARPYSVLTHEEVIDLLWQSDIQPLLLQRYPNSTPEQLKNARAYAYGGAVIQDLGYYPFGSQLFSDLVHYTRTGDFVANLINSAQDVNEFAFALGALAHYSSDTMGHPAVNRSVAIEYPELRRKYGDKVTYAQSHGAHLKTEFGFDVVQVAKARYAPQSFHDFIGFEVSKPLLERAFQQSYGIPLKEVIAHEDLAIGSYRRAVSGIIPSMTKVALATRGTRMTKEYPNFDRKKFLYRLSRVDYEKTWGKQYEKPGIGARILAVILRVVPRFGPFRGLAYKDPTPQTEDLYFKSVNETVDFYRQLLRQVRQGDVHFDNRDFDTGLPTKLGEYPMTDDAYACLVHKLSVTNFAGLDEPLRANIVEFFASRPKLGKTNQKQCWEGFDEAFAKLKQAQVVQSSAVNGK